jgi:hypothetical protein
MMPAILFVGIEKSGVRLLYVPIPPPPMKTQQHMPMAIWVIALISGFVEAVILVDSPIQYQLIELWSTGWESNP